MPGTVLDTFSILLLIRTIIFQLVYYHPRFTNEELRVRMCRRLTQNHIITKQKSWIQSLCFIHYTSCFLHAPSLCFSLGFKII